MNNKGFTSIELITVLVLIGIIIIPTSNYIGLLHQYSFTKNNANNAMEVQATISRINFELQPPFLSSVEGTDTPGETIKKTLIKQIFSLADKRQKHQPIIILRIYNIANNLQK